MQLTVFIHASRRVKSVEALFELFVQTMKSIGYDRINFSIFSAYDISKPFLGFGQINTYPEHWQRYYVENNCRRFDPVARCATSMFRPFYWSELERLMPLTPRQRRFLRDAEAAGLHNGIGIPFKGPMCQVAGIALATSVKEVKDLPCLDMIMHFCTQFFEVFRSFVAKPPRPPKSELLAARECQILEWAGRGLIDSEIGEQLGIKSSTVDSYMRAAFAKLQAKTRANAVVIGIKMGLIDP